MAGRGPAPKPAHLRQRTNKKAGSATIEAPNKPNMPPIPNPDGRIWHTLTEKAWREFFASPMASQWIDTDITGLGQLAIMYDEFYKAPDIKFLQEIRLQRQSFGLSPLDRSRLQWEVSRGEEAERKRQKPQAQPRGIGDPRAILRLA